MKPSVHDLEEEKLKKEISVRRAKIVLVQLPEGLKTEGPRIATLVEKSGALAIVSADPCYGACDLPIDEAESLGADLVVHFGHTEFVGSPERIPIIYIDAKANINLRSAVKKALPLLRSWEDIGLVTTVQHVNMLEKARVTLTAAHKTVKVGNAGRLKYPGQVIGCDYSNAKCIANDVDAFLFVGGGRFHAIGIGLATSKPTVVADPYEQRAYSVDSDFQRIVKQRWATIERARSSEHFGILVGLKSGQGRLQTALRVSAKLRNAGRKTTLFCVREITPEALLEFPTIDAYVNTACPRISLDDAGRFQKPVITVMEALTLTGELTWEQLLKRGWLEE